MSIYWMNTLRNRNVNSAGCSRPPEVVPPFHDSQTSPACFPTSGGETPTDRCPGLVRLTMIVPSGLATLTLRLLRAERLMHERVMFAPMMEVATLHAVGPKVLEPAIGITPLTYFPTPYEDMHMRE